MRMAWRMSKCEQRPVPRSDDPAHLAMIALDWGSGVSEANLAIWTDFYSPVSSNFAYVYTDRRSTVPARLFSIKASYAPTMICIYSLPGLKNVDVTIDTTKASSTREQLP